MSRKRKASKKRPAPGRRRQAPPSPAAPRRPAAGNATRSRIILVVIGGALAVAILAWRGGLASSSPGPTPPSSPVLLASTDGQAQGQTADGISCDRVEQLVYHIHAELIVFIDGQRRIIPYGIGIVPPISTQPSSVGPVVIAGSCFYWLHSHTQDGIVHVESPSLRSYTLGNYFDIWGQLLTSTQVGPASGQVTAYLNGQRFSSDPRSIPLTNHAIIQLDVGKNVAPQRYTFGPQY